MALDLNEYIKMSYERPNRKVLEGLGASEDLIEYLMETPGNTNWNVVDSITNSGGEEAEVWLVGNEYQDHNGLRYFILSNNGNVDYMTELNTNPEDYQVSLSGVELLYTDIIEEGDDKTTTWLDSSIAAEETQGVTISKGIDDSISAYAYYADATTAPTSVEVSVKAK